MHIGINVVAILFQIILRGTRVSELEARDLLVKTESVETAGVQFIIT